MDNKTKPNVHEKALYAKRTKIQTRAIEGRFNRLRNIAMVVLLGIFYIGPWVQWGGRQAVLWDLPARKFYIFGLTIWPQDFIFLSAILIIMALALFFFTTLAGRLWCGYACPQTVWTEAMMWIENKIEGTRNQRLKLDKAPWNANKIRRRGGKYVAWVLFSVWTGYTFVGYFSAIRELGFNLLAFQAGPNETFWVFFYGFLTLLLAGFMREQVCIYMCPYARFQSVMFDPNTLIISYDVDRGEPRGHAKKQKKLVAEGGAPGDCVDCSICVQVCPMGIDIRDGLQYQCIGCALCVDACDEVMEKVKKPKGLIRYTTENLMDGKNTKVLRPRVFVYAAMLVGMFAAVGYGLATRDLLGVDVIRDRNTLYRDVGDGTIENLFRLRIMNKDDVAHQYSVHVEDLPGATILTDKDLPVVKSGDIIDHIIRIVVNPDELNGERSVEFGIRLQADDKPELTTTTEARYLGPGDF